MLGFGEEDFWRFFPYKCIGKQTWPCRKKVKRQRMTILLAILVDLPSRWFLQRFSPKAFSVLEEKIFKGFYHIWAWRPSWSTDLDHFSNFSFPHPKEAPYEIWAKLAQRFQRRSRLKMLTDGRTDGRTDDRRKVITIAHPEQSSGELKTGTKKIDRRKERNLDFLSPGKKTCLFSLFHRKETDTWSLKQEELRHTGNCQRDLLD